MAQEQTAIVVKGIKQAYKKVPVLHDVNFTVQKGGIVRHSSDDKPVIGANSSVIRHNQKWRG